MEREKRGWNEILTPLCFLLPLWLVASASLSSWKREFAEFDTGWQITVMAVLSLFYSLAFLARWEKLRFAYVNVVFALAVSGYLFFSSDIRMQLNCLWHHIRKKIEEVYGIPALPDSLELREYSVEPAVALLFFCILWLTLYLFWREAPLLLQVFPLTCFYLFPIILDASLEQGTMVSFFGGALLWWIVGRYKHPKRWMALACGVPVFLLSICLVGLVFSEERYRSLLSMGSGVAGIGEGTGMGLQRAKATLFGQFAPEGYITYDNITMYELTVQSHLNQKNSFYLKNFEADTYRDGAWTGEEKRNLWTAPGHLSVLKSGGLKVEKLTTTEDVVAYGDNTVYQTDSLGRVVLPQESRLRRYQPQLDKWEECLSRPLHKKEISGEELPKSMKKLGKKFLGKKFRGSYRELVEDIKTIFEEKFIYTMAPGRPPEGKDEVSYFLKTSHRGYCVHFASAAVFLFRSQGVQARYAQGYCLKPQILREKYPMQVKDSMAHAWVEIRIGDCYVPVDVTPSARWSVENTGMGYAGMLPAVTEPPKEVEPSPSPTAPAPEKDGESRDTAGGQVPSWFLTFVLSLLSALFGLAVLGGIIWCVRRGSPRRLYRKCVRMGDWKSAVWLLQEAFLDFMEDSGFVWEETGRERTRERLRYAVSMWVYVKDERELYQFYERLDWYIEMIFSLRYGKTEAERENWYGMVEIMRKLVNDKKKRESGVRRVLSRTMLARMLKSSF